MPLDAKRFRQTMGQLATGVTVVTVRPRMGHALGMTASAVASLSLDPPLLLVSVGRDALIHDHIVAAERFGVNVLAAGQEAAAERFATRERQPLDERELVLSPGGVPVLAGSLARIECVRREHFPGGDHTIITGELVWADGGDGAPLCYFQGRFGRLVPWGSLDR
jgi:flavin reductase (DIM6/NTAB) family NADH-FMN oxidoreductase RutF